MGQNRATTACGGGCVVLAHGADPNEPDARGRTGLIHAIGSSISGDSNTVAALLLESGANPNPCSPAGWTALMTASMRGYTPIVELLLRRGADPNTFTDAAVMERKEGCSNTNALMWAIGNRHLPVVKALLDYGANPRAVNSDSLPTS